MGNGDDRIDVKVGAQTGELKAGMDQATAKVAQATANMEKQFQGKFANIAASTQKMTGEVTAGIGSIEATVARATGIIGVFMAILGGGAMLKGAVDEYIQFNSEVKKLSTTMGVTMQDAAAFGFAFKRAGVDGDTLTQQLRMLERQTHAGGDAMQAMAAKVGVNIDFSEGLEKTYLKVLEALGKYKEGHDRNQASIDAFGNRVQITGTQLKVTTEAIEEQAQKLQKLGLAFDDISAAKAKKFKEGMFDINLQFDAMKYKIGEIIIPVLTSLGQAFIWVANQASHLVEVARAAANAPLASGPRGGGGGGTWPGDEKGPESEKPGATYDLPPKGSGGSSGGGGGGKSRLQEWTDELNQMKVAENAFLDYSKEQERQFWQDKLQKCHEGSQEYLQVQQRLFQLAKELAKESVQEELAALNLKQASEKTNMTQRLALEDQKLALLAAKYGQDSQQYRQGLQQKQQLLNQAEKEANQLEQQKLDNHLKLAQMDLDMERQKLAFKREMGIISAVEEMTQLKLLKDQEILLEMANFEKLKLIWAKYPVEMQKIQSQMALAEKKSLADREKAEEQAALATKNKYQQVMAPLNQAISSSIQGMIQGTQNVSQVINNALQNILVSYLGMTAQMVANWIAGEAARVTATTASAAARATVETTAAATTKGVKVASGLQGIGTDAAEGAAAAYKAMAGIPIIGPALGAVAAAATFAGIIAYKTMIPSAAMGWDIPADSLAYVHKKEMVLPTNLSERIRTMTDPAGPARGIQIDKLNFAPTVLMKERMTHAYAEEITRKYLVSALRNELDRFGANLGGG